jgi:hypothetical protein
VSAGRWIALALATIAGFFVVGAATALFVLAFGQTLIGWHDNIGPELRCGVIGGFAGAICVALYLHGRWSAPARGRTE